DGECISYWRVDAKGRIGAAATLLVSGATLGATLQRLKAVEPIGVWQLELRPGADGRRPGFAAIELRKGDHASASLAV
ncbi:hypothetical protein, partial [Ideonella azotifigens]|uniref:hypothetical protein n=1 Tax=Ideonella azotifigens TaxID=513160 RepID=UPI0031D09114